VVPEVFSHDRWNGILPVYYDFLVDVALVMDHHSSNYIVFPFIYPVKQQDFPDREDEKKQRGRVCHSESYSPAPVDERTLQRLHRGNPGRECQASGEVIHPEFVNPGCVLEKENVRRSEGQDNHDKQVSIDIMPHTFSAPGVEPAKRQ